MHGEAFLTGTPGQTEAGQSCTRRRVRGGGGSLGKNARMLVALAKLLLGSSVVR